MERKRIKKGFDTKRRYGRVEGGRGEDKVRVGRATGSTRGRWEGNEVNRRVGGRGGGREGERIGGRDDQWW